LENKNPHVTFVMITARESFSYPEKPEMHVFEATMHCFKEQTMKSFEVVVVDALYHKRKDYFKNLHLDFKVKHVPAQPNLWVEKGSPGICTQYNKGIIYADGELLFFTGDSYMFRSDFMKNLWERYTQGFFPLAWYLYDHTNGGARKYHEAGTPRHVSPVPYNILGYDGQDVFVEHRYDVAFRNKREVFPAPWEWWFGCSSASLEAMLTINGFSMRFDGDRMLLDCDVGSRLELAGYGHHLALFKNIFLIRIPTDASVWSSIVSKSAPSIKCQLPLIHYSRYLKRPRANTENITEEEIKWMKEEFCVKYCHLRKTCPTEHPWQYPFEHKEGYVGHSSNKALYEFWKNTPTIIDLREERQKRINGDQKYMEGTFT